MTSPPDFDRIYSANPDPFRVGDSWYEQRKVAIVLASLVDRRYRHIWDTACGTGHLAAMMANRCDGLLASDASAEACRISTERLAALPNVRVALHALPSAPEAADRFDLVVLSEVVYYLPSPALQAIAPLLEQVTVSDRTAEVVVVNWRHFPADAYCSGVDAVARLDYSLHERGWHSVVRHRDEEFVLHSWRRSAGRPR